MYLKFYYKTNLLTFVAQKKQIKPFLLVKNILQNRTLKLNLFLFNSKMKLLEPNNFSYVKQLAFINLFFFNIVFKQQKLKINKNLRILANKYHKRKIQFALSSKTCFSSTQFNTFEVLTAVNFFFHAAKTMLVKKIVTFHNNFLIIPWLYNFNLQNTYFVTKTITKHTLIGLRVFKFGFAQNTLVFLKLLNLCHHKPKTVTTN